MPDNRQQELLSAYLDGELSPEEQAEVEQLLATQPEARQMLDDLRALSGTLQSLPRQHVGQDLAALVLRRAERAMLANAPGNVATSKPESASPAPNGKAAKSDPPTLKVAAAEENTSARPRFEVSVGRSRRGWVWAAMTLAAALMLLVYDRTRAPEQHLAQGPAGGGKDLAFESRQDRSEATVDAFAAHDPSGDGTSDDAAESLGRASDEVAQKNLHKLDHLADSREANLYEAQSNNAERSSGVAPGEKPTAVAAEQRAIVQNSRGTNREAMRRQAAADAPLARNLKGEVGDAQDRGRSESGDAEVSNVAGGKGTAGKPEDNKLAATARKSESTAATPAPAGEPLVAAPAIAAPSQQQMAIRVAPAQAALAIAGTEVRAEPTEILVVHLHVTPEALRDGAFEQVMATQNVRWEDEPASSADANQAADKAGAPKKDSIDKDATKADAEEEHDADARAGQDRFSANGVVVESAAKQAAVELLKRIAARESDGSAPAGGRSPQEETAAPTGAAIAKPSAPSDEPVAEAPAKVQALKVKPQLAEAKEKELEKLNESAELKKSVDRPLIRGLADKSDAAQVEGGVPSSGPQYAVLVEAPAANVQQTLAQLAADGRFVVQIESQGVPASGEHGGQSLGGGGGGGSGQAYFNDNKAKGARTFGAPSPAESTPVPKGAPAPVADAVTAQPLPANAPARLTPKSELKVEVADAPVAVQSGAGQVGAGQPGKLQMRIDASGKRTRDVADERAKQFKAREGDGLAESNGRAWRIEVPRPVVADFAAEPEVEGVAGKQSKSKSGRANVALGDKEHHESLELKPAPGTKPAAAAPGLAVQPTAPAPLAVKSNALNVVPTAPSAEEAAAATATLGIAVPQNVRVLFVVRVASSPDASTQPAPAATPADGESPK